MDLSFRTIHDVIHPTAAFSVDFRLDDGAVQVDPWRDDACDDWEASQLNPKNRIDSLDPLDDPLWRIDGATGLGTQFYAFPLFLADIPPMRLDVFICEGASYPPLLRALLDLDQAFHIRDAERIRRLGISRYILRILQLHTHSGGNLGRDAVAELYERGPFGSRILIQQLSLNIRDCQIRIHHNHALERDLLSYRDLKSMWSTDAAKAETEYPPQLSMDNLVLVRQLYDSISLVHLRGGEEMPGSDSKLFLLKSVTSQVKFMYHELHELLFRIPSHANIIAKPMHVVTKQCLFGRKTGVVGFTLHYHPLGTLRDTLPLLRIHSRLELWAQFRWATQLATAMCAIWRNGHHTFYPDLRLDNIVSSASGDVVLIDFEQRGVWCGFSAPEVEFFENLRILAMDDPESDYAIPDDVREQYREELAKYIKSGDEESLETLMEETKYSKTGASYNIAWLCLGQEEREAAMVYMLGRVLWCIFEGMSAPHRGAIWQSYRWEPEVEFPRFHRTPPEVRNLILRCFGETSAREQTQFVRVASKVYMKETSNPTGYVLSADNLGAKAKAFWGEKLREGDKWLKARSQRQKTARPGDRYGRPSLENVTLDLQALQAKLAPEDA